MKVLHEPDCTLQRSEFFWRHRIRIEVHNIIPDHTHLIEKLRQCCTIYFQTELHPDLRVLKELHVLPERQIGHCLSLVLRSWRRAEQVKVVDR